MENCCVCLTRNFGHQVSETRLLIVKFRFVPKSQRKSVLCYREISLKRRQIVTRTFAQTFLESSREQRMKFAHFACVTFAQYCNITILTIYSNICKQLKIELLNHDDTAKSIASSGFLNDFIQSFVPQYQ